MTTFHSTRSSTDALTSKQAIRKGIADDGGLFVTDQLGETTVDISALAGKSYQQIAFDVLSVLLPDFGEDELKQCIAEAYGSQWSDERITPVKPLGDDYVMELFNGPTCAFKDVALQILPRFMARTTPADGDADEKIMIVTATSGDTGKAALAGFADAAGTGITVFYPQGRVSRVQELQMTTQTGSNVHVCAVNGNFDDAQSTVKEIFGDQELAERLAADDHVVLSSANSINVGRLVPQVVYYFSAYAQLLEQQVINVGDEVDFVVPTGNFGDVLAGYYAKMLGLPVRQLVVASDKNNVLFDFLTTGTYNRNRPFYETISPSMDILISSNLERMLYYMGRRGPGAPDDRRMLARQPLCDRPAHRMRLFRDAADAGRPGHAACAAEHREPLQVPARGQRGAGAQGRRHRFRMHGRARGRHRHRGARHAARPGKRRRAVP